MSYSSGLVLAPAGSYPSTGDIQQALGVDSGNLGVLCTSPNINIFAKYKPIGITGYEQPTAAQLLAARYGLSARATNSRNSLRTMAMGWTYNGAIAPYYRQLDFDRYYNGAIVPFMQANGDTLLVDLVSGNANPALFYMMMRSGALANKPFSAASGIAQSGTAVPSNRLDYCLTVEDIGFDSGGGTWHDILGAYLGLVIFQGTSYRGEVWASQAVAQLSTRVNEMFNVPTSSLDLAPGTYQAVACAKKTEGSLTYYLPVYDDASYPTRFSLVVGGVDYYKQDRVGLALTSTASSTTTMLTTTASTIYVRMRLYNQTGHSVTLNVRDGRFVLSTRITGTVVDQTGTHSIDRTQTSGIAYPTSDVTVADGSYAELTFAITNIWSNNASTTPSFIESGSLNIVPSLQFYRGGTTTDFGQYGVPRVLGCNYGS